MLFTPDWAAVISKTFTGCAKLDPGHVCSAVATLFPRKLTISDFDEDLALIGAVKA
jgi:hypothetical protein